MYKTHRRLELTLAAFGLLGLTVPQAISAQTRALAVVGGAWQYDLSGTGTSGFGGLRLELPVSRTFLIEPGLTYASYSTQFDQGVSLSCLRSKRNCRYQASGYGRLLEVESASHMPGPAERVLPT
jgi:hypothetical protein